MTETTTKAFQGELTQTEVNYVTLSSNRAKACANCRWCIADCNDCYIVEDSPEPILVTGYCDRWEAVPTPEPAPDMAEVIGEAIGEALSESMGMPVMEASMTKPKSLADRLRSMFGKKPTDSSFSVFKGNDGKDYFHAIFTNNFEDREDEILTSKAHDKFIARLDMGLVPMPVLQAWHTPGTEHGQADVVWRSDHFVHAIGHFYDTPDAAKAVKFYRKNAGKIKMSHGFIVPDGAFDGKHYDDYNTIEITTLPPYAAANPFTSFEELLTMSKMTEDKRRYVEGLFGKEKLAEIEQADEQRGKALEDLKMAYKEFTDATPPAPAAAPTDREKALVEVYSELVGTQDEMMTLLASSAKAIKARDERIDTLEAKFGAELEALKKDNDALRALVNQPPRRASQDDSTTVAKDGDLKDALPKQDSLQNWLGLPVKQPQ